MCPIHRCMALDHKFTYEIELELLYFSWIISFTVSAIHIFASALVRNMLDFLMPFLQTAAS